MPDTTRSGLSGSPYLRAGLASLLIAVLCLGLVEPAPALAEGPASSEPAPPGPEQPPIVVYLDGLTVEFDVPPVIASGRTLVPFRLLAEALGCTVDWLESERRVHAVGPVTAAPPEQGSTPQPARVVDIWVDRTEALVNGAARTMDVPARIVDGRTLIPLRFFGEAMRAVVDWHADTRTITVTSPRRPMEVVAYYALGDATTSSWAELYGAPYPGVAVGATDIVSDVVMAWYVLDPATGAIVLNDSYSAQKRPDNWRDVVARARDYRMRPHMMVHWAKWGADGVCDPAIYEFLSNPDSMSRAVREILEHAADYDGVNLDIEYLGQRQTGDALAETRREYVEFVGMVADALHAQGKELSLSLHPANTWFPGHDWEALGQVADRLVIMAYGYTSSGPQPVTKVTEAVDLAVQAVPAEKLLLGLLAGKDGGFETPETLAVKVGVAKRRGIAGIALWRLGVWGADRLEVIRNALCRP